MTRVIGLDLSITATGIADHDGRTSTIKPSGTGDTRLIDIASNIWLISHGATLVAIEDLPRNAKAAGITGMVHGIVRHSLLVNHHPYALIPPASLKAYATGKGNADKTAMALAAFKRAGVEFTDDNQCDAAWLRWMALDWLGEPEFAMPQAQRAALSKVVWPEVRCA